MLKNRRRTVAWSALALGLLMLWAIVQRDDRPLLIVYGTLLTLGLAYRVRQAVRCQRRWTTQETTFFLFIGGMFVQTFCHWRGGAWKAGEIIGILLSLVGMIGGIRANWDYWQQPVPPLFSRRPVDKSAVANERTLS